MRNDELQHHMETAIVALVLVAEQAVERGLEGRESGHPFPLIDRVDLHQAIGAGKDALAIAKRNRGGK